MNNRSNAACAHTASRALTLTISMVGLGLISLAGCAKPTDFESVVNDLSPEMKTPTERSTDVSGHVAFSNDLNLRNFWADLGRVWHTDRPSRLSPYPIGDLSGVPQ